MDVLAERDPFAKGHAAAAQVRVPVQAARQRGTTELEEGGHVHPSARWSEAGTRTVRMAC